MPVYKRGDRWYADVQHGGRRIKRSVKEGGRREAKELEAALLDRLRNADKKIHYLDDAIAKWLDEYASRLKSYAKFAEHAKQLAPFVKGRLLTDAPTVAAEYATATVNRAPATINQRLRILRRVANLAFADWQWIDVPIGKRIKTLRENNRRTLYLSRAEVDAVCALVDDDVALAVRFASLTGLRLGELLRAQPEWIVGNTLRLPAETKSGKPRSIPLPEAARAVPLPLTASRNRIQDQFRKATRKAGLQGVRFHDLRHTYASWLLQRGASLSAVCELLGHSTVAITKDLYGHLEQSHLEAAVKLLDADESQQSPKPKRKGRSKAA